MRIVLYIVCFFLSCFQLEAQSRYLDEVFSEVSITKDVTYGTNINLYSFPFVEDIREEELKADIYAPIGDTLEERPLVLVIHDGYFLPPQINGSIIGSRKDSSVVEICTQLAKRGFTSAAISYRLGWNPLSPSSVQIATSLIQAMYRSVQDGRTAIRYFRKNYFEDGNEFGIDPERIVVWGNGTGGVVALNMVGLSDINDILFTTNSPAKFLFDADGDLVPDIPMVLEEFHGDIEGKNLTIAPYDLFSFEEGDTTSLSNHKEYSSEFNLSLNVGGAVGDLGWLEDNSIPMISVQHIYDRVWPYDDYNLVFHPGTLIFAMQGARYIGELQDSLGNNQEWKEGLESTNPLTQQAISNSNNAGHPYFEGTYPVVNPANSFGVYEGVVIDWWDPNSLSPFDSLPWNETPYPGTLDLSYHDVMLSQNENMSADKAKLTIDTILNYFAPRACITLDLEECMGDIFTSIGGNMPEGDEIQCFPNPTNHILNIKSKSQLIEKIEIYSTRGEKIKVIQDVNSKFYQFGIDGLKPKIYAVKIYLENGFIFKRIVVN